MLAGHYLGFPLHADQADVLALFEYQDELRHKVHSLIHDAIGVRAPLVRLHTDGVDVVGEYMGPLLPGQGWPQVLTTG